MKRKREDEQDRSRKKIVSRSWIQTLRNLIRRSTTRRFNEFARRRQLPSYEIDVTRSNGNIHTVTARPITTGSNNYSLEAAQRTIGSLLRTFVRNEVSQQTGWSPALAARRIRGFIQVTNIMNPMSTQFYPFSRLSEINQARIDEIFSNVQQSETEIPFEYLEWMIVLDPSIYQVGSGVTLASIRKGLGWQNHFDVQGRINCAAIALTLLIRKNRFDKRPDLLKKYF